MGKENSLAAPRLLKEQVKNLREVTDVGHGQVRPLPAAAKLGATGQHCCPLQV